MKVSVVISTYTRERYFDIVRCISSLKCQTKRPYEILLVVEPEVYTFYKNNFPELLVIKSSGGLSAARNAGAERATGDLVAFIDDDAWADKHWLERITKPFEDGVQGAGGKVIPVFEQKPKWVSPEMYWVFGCTYNGMKFRNPIGANMCFSKDVFENVKFRDTLGRKGKKLMCGEETQFAIDLRKQGAKIVYVPDAIVYHRVPKNRTSVRYVIKRAYYEGFSKAMIDDLSAEEHYIQYLLKTVKKVNPLKASILLLMAAMTVFGFACGNIFVKYPAYLHRVWNRSKQPEKEAC